MPITTGRMPIVDTGRAEDQKQRVWGGSHRSMDIASTRRARSQDARRGSKRAALNRGSSRDRCHPKIWASNLRTFLFLNQPFAAFRMPITTGRMLIVDTGRAEDQKQRVWGGS